MKKFCLQKIVFLAILVLVLTGTTIPTTSAETAAATPDGMQCVETGQEKGRIYLKNTCDRGITVAYCATQRNWVRPTLCGERKRFYTYLKTLDPGQKGWVGNVGGEIKYGACMGWINSWSIKGQFTSDGNGEYGCYVKRLDYWPSR